MLGPVFTRPMACGVYDIANAEAQAVSVVTNTTPTTAYRGAGRPEATAAIERAMDLFAYELEMDPVEVRRKNLIAKFDDGFTTAVGQTYDVGDYEGSLDAVLEAADYAGLRAEQANRLNSNSDKQLGIGVSIYVEVTGGVDPMGEAGRIEVNDDGTASVYTGTSPQGQGHDTAWSMIASGPNAASRNPMLPWIARSISSSCPMRSSPSTRSFSRPTGARSWSSSGRTSRPTTCATSATW